MSTDELLASLAAGGALEARGSFSIDKEKAREKMRQFQLPDPRQYVLMLVQAAVHQGATRIEFQIDADDMEVWFDGEGFSKSDLDDVFVSMFGDRGDTNLRARQELAIALNGALALNPRWIRVWSHHGGEAVKLELRGDTTGDAATCGARDEGGTKVHVKQRFRPGLLIDFVRNLQGTNAEEFFLRERARYASVQIVLDGGQISSGMRLGAHTGRVEIDLPSVRGACGFRLEHSLEPATLEVLHAGVWMASHPLPMFPAGFVAMVDGRALRKDVSQADVVRDDAYQEVLARLGEGLERSLLSLVMRYHEDPADWDELPYAIRSRMPQWIAERMESPWRLEALGDVMAYYLALPVWQQLDGAWVSTKALRGRDQVDYISRPDRYPRGFERAIRAETSELRSALRSIFGNGARNQTAAYEQAASREAQKAKVLSRPWNTSLGEGLYLAREHLRGKARGEVGIRRNDREVAIIQLVYKGNLLETIALDAKHLNVPGFVAVVEGAFEPRADWQRARRNQSLAKVLHEVAEALQRALVTAGRAAAGLTGDPNDNPALVRHLRSLAAVAQMEDFDRAFYRAAGFSQQRASRWKKAFGTVAKPNPYERHPLLSLPLFPTLEPSVDVSAAFLRSMYSKASPVKVLPTQTERLPDLPGFVLVDPEGEALVTAIVGEDAVEDGWGALKAALARIEWERKTPVEFALPTTDVVEEIHYERDGVEVKAGMLGRATVGPPTGKMQVRLMVSRREVDTVWLESPIDDVVVAVDWPSAPLAKSFTAIKAVGLETVEMVLAEIPGRLLAATLGRVQNGNRDAAVLDRLRRLTFAPFAGEGWMQPFHERHDWARTSAGEQLARLNRRVHGGRSNLGARAAEAAFRGEVEPIEPRPGTLESLALAVSEHWVVLLDIPMLEGLQRWISIRGVLDDIERHGKALLLHTRDVVEVVGDVPRDLLVAEREDRDLLWRVFGRGNLTDGKTWLRRWQAREAFEQQPKQELSLPRASVLVTVKPGGTLRGEIGVPRSMPGGGSASITACRRHRPVCDVDVPEAGASFVGVLQKDTFGVESNFKGLSREDTAAVTAACVAARADLAKALGKAWPSFEGHDQDLARAWALVLLDLMLREDGEKALSSPGGSALAKVPAFAHADGTFWSLRSILNANGQGEPVFVWHDSASFDGPELPKLVFTDTLEVVRVLSAAQVDFGDFEEVRRAKKARATNRKAAPPAWDPPPDAIAKMRIGARGARGELWIDPQMDTSAIALGDGQKIAGTLKLPGPFIVAGSIHGKAVSIDETWSFAELSKRGIDLLQQRARDLYKVVLDRFDPQATERDFGWLRDQSVLRSLATRMQTDRDAGRKSGDSATRRMHRELRQVPLFELPSGHMASLEQIERLNAEDAAPKPERRTPKRPSAKPKPKPKPKPRSGPAEVEPERERKPRPQAKPAPEPVAPPSPEAILLDAIRTELRVVRRASPGVFSNAMLDLIGFGHVSRGALAEFRKGWVHIARDHAVTRLALAADVPPARVVSMMASSVFSAFNLGLEEVTDAEEVRFHGLHAEHLAT